MDLEEAIRNRRSIRQFEDRPVPVDLIRKAIDLAVWAPSASNIQQWRFFVVTDRARIGRMADALKAKGELMATWPEMAPYEAAVKGVAKNSSVLRGAPAVVAIGVADAPNPMDAVLKSRASDSTAAEILAARTEAASGVQTAAAVAMQLELALYSLGLGTLWMVGPMIARGDIERILEVPEGVHLCTLIPVGYPAESPAPQARKPAEEIVRVI